MNSFYGVFATDACRFFDVRLATNIVLPGPPGHRAPRASASRRPATGSSTATPTRCSSCPKPGSGIRRRRRRGAGGIAERVVARGARRAADGLESHLEVELEARYARFLMPTVRGGAIGQQEALRRARRDGDGRRSSRLVDEGARGGAHGLDAAGAALPARAARAGVRGRRLGGAGARHARGAVRRESRRAPGLPPPAAPRRRRSPGPAARPRAGRPQARSARQLGALRDDARRSRARRGAGLGAPITSTTSSASWHPPPTGS